MKKVYSDVKVRMIVRTEEGVGILDPPVRPGHRHGQQDRALDALESGFHWATRHCCGLDLHLWPTLNKQVIRSADIVDRRSDPHTREEHPDPEVLRELAHLLQLRIRCVDARCPPGNRCLGDIVGLAQ